MVLPKDISNSVPGYLSLHSSSVTTGSGLQVNGIALKWTPNQLMNGSTIEDKSVSWQYALYLEFRTIQFIHCHQVIPLKQPRVLTITRLRSSLKLSELKNGFHSFKTNSFVILICSQLSNLINTINKMRDYSS
jgi:hypothetical protein